MSLTPGVTDQRERDTCPSPIFARLTKVKSEDWTIAKVFFRGSYAVSIKRYQVYQAMGAANDKAESVSGETEPRRSSFGPFCVDCGTRCEPKRNASLSSCNSKNRGWVADDEGTGDPTKARNICTGTNTNIGIGIGVGTGTSKGEGEPFSKRLSKR